MFRSRLYVWVILALALPVQTIAAVSPQPASFEHESGTAPVVQMDCHDQQASEDSGPPSCCGDSCPDMTFCAATPAVSATAMTLLGVAQLTVPDDSYLLPLVSSRLSSPFRPPTISVV
jgi:hypothetical protein